ncbi:MAG: flagellar protein FliT [Lautropia sp.]|nr:flagellar protein FliT [Lautropia sp.]
MFSSTLAEAYPVEHDESGVELPPQYQAALLLAESMLTAARAGDWEGVRNLRSALPQLAADLEESWQALADFEPDARRLLEEKRLKMIREILNVDERIRRLSSPAYARLSPWLQTVPAAAPIVTTPQTTGARL